MSKNNGQQQYIGVFRTLKEFTSRVTRFTKRLAGLVLFSRVLNITLFHTYLSGLLSALKSVAYVGYFAKMMVRLLEKHYGLPANLADKSSDDTYRKDMLILIAMSSVTFVLDAPEMDTSLFVVSFYFTVAFKMLERILKIILIEKLTQWGIALMLSEDMAIMLFMLTMTAKTHWANAKSVAMRGFETVGGLWLELVSAIEKDQI